MIGETAQVVTQRLVRKGLEPPFARTVRRELRKARASGILYGLRTSLRPGDICIDGGAHKGEVTTFLAESGAEVHAFEPDPDNFAELEFACQGLNGVKLHRAALGAEAGTAELFRSKVSEHNLRKGATGSSIRVGNSAASGTGLSVEVIDFTAFLKGLLDRHGSIAFVKLDVEGSELEVVEAMIRENLLEHIRLTVVETHRWLFPTQGRRYDRLHELAESRPDLNLFLGWI